MGHKEFQLVLQLPATSGEDFDELIAIEDAMEITFAGLPHEVDGHDFGSGEMNIFIQGQGNQALVGKCSRLRRTSMRAD